MQGKIDELWLQTHTAVSPIRHFYKCALPIERFLYYCRCLLYGLDLYAGYHRLVMATNKHCSLFNSERHFGRAYTRNSIATGRIGTLDILNDCLLSEMAFFELKLIARNDWRVMAPNTHRTIFPISHLCVRKLQVVFGRCADRTTALISETFLLWFRVAWESYSPRNAFAVLWFNSIVTIYCKPVSIAISCATTHVIKTDAPYDCILHTKRRFSANNAWFYKNKFG